MYRFHEYQPNYIEYDAESKMFNQLYINCFQYKHIHVTNIMYISFYLLQPFVISTSSTGAV